MDRNDCFSGLKKSILVCVSAFLFLAYGCKKSTPRMLEKFEGETLNVPPPQFPSPNPPADNLGWSQQFMQAKVVEKPGGGNWVQIKAKENYFSRGVASILLAFSEPFNVGNAADISGSFTMRLDGSGFVNISILGITSESQSSGSPLGGYSIRNGVGSADINTLTSSDILTSFNNPLIHNGTFLANYKPGQAADFTWSIAQKGRLMFRNVSPGGAAESMQIDENSISIKGAKNFPLQRISIEIDGYEWDRTTTLFIDDIKINEDL